MDYAAIERLIKIVNESDLRELELEETGLKIKMSKNVYSDRSDKVKEATIISTPVVTKESVVTSEVKNEINIVEKKEEAVTSTQSSLEGCIMVKSPMVGTFYAAPSEGAEPFAKVGDKVSKGDILCIVEAMKLMNEIECENDGVIAEILVSNGEVVEYGQPLIAIKSN
ncbi:MAG: acetyl-CoA carboxylase biotin carboxyl carrier protein [Clostridium sp.]